MNKYQEALHNLRQIEQERNTWDINSDVLQELVNKATPKKPISQLQEVFFNKIPDEIDDDTPAPKKLNYFCFCGSWVGDEIYHENYCKKCGQAIDWDEIARSKREYFYKTKEGVFDGI